MEETTELLRVFALNAVIPYLFFMVALFCVILFYEYLGDIPSIIIVYVLGNAASIVWLGGTYHDLSIRAELKQYMNIPIYIYIIFTSFTVFVILISILLSVIKRKYKKK